MCCNHLYVSPDDGEGDDAALVVGRPAEPRRPVDTSLVHVLAVALEDARPRHFHRDRLHRFRQCKCLRNSSTRDTEVRPLPCKCYQLLTCIGLFLFLLVFKSSKHNLSKAPKVSNKLLNILCVYDHLFNSISSFLFRLFRIFSSLRCT